MSSHTTLTHCWLAGQQPVLRSRVVTACLLLIGLVVVPGCSDQKQQARSLVRQAIARQKDDEHTNAAKLLDRAIALDDELPQAHFARGVSHMSLREYSLAELCFRTSLELNPKQPRAWWMLGTIYRLQEEREQAVHALTEAVNLETGYTDARFDRACLLQIAGHDSDAIADFDQVLQWNPNHIDAMFHRGVLSRRIGRFDSAGHDLSRVIRLNRQSEHAWYERAIVRQLMKDFERGLADVTVACRLDAERPKFWRLRAELLESLGRHPEAAVDYGRVHRLTGSDPSALRHSAALFEKSGQTERAMEAIESVLNLDAPSADDFALRSRLHNSHGNFTAEGEDLERSWQLNPENNATGVRLVHSRIRNRNLDGALSLSAELLTRADIPHDEMHWIRARLFKQLDRPQEAVSSLSQLLTMPAHRDNALRCRAPLHLQLEQWTAAEFDYSELIERHPDELDLWVARSRAREAAGAIKTAASDLVAAIQLGDDTIDSHYRLARMEISLGATDDAEARLENLLKVSPDHAAAMEALAGLSLQEKEFGRILETLSDIPADAANCADLYYLRAIATWETIGPQASEQDLDKAVAANHKHIPSRLLRARVRMALEQPEAALQDVSRVLQQNPHHADAFVVRGLIQRSLQNIAAAEQSFDRAIQANPDSIEAREQRAEVRLQLVDLAGAIADASKIADRPGARRTRAAAFFLQENYQAVLDDLDWLNQHEVPTTIDTEQLWVQAQCCEQLGRLDGLLELLTVILDASPEHTPARHARARLLQQLGRLHEALQDIDTALQQDTSLANAWLMRGKINQQLGEHQDAFADLTRATELLPDSSDAFYRRALTQMRLQAHHAAESDIEQAIRLDGQVADYWYWRGNIIALLGEQQAAVENFQQAIRLNPQHHAAWYNRGNLLFESRDYVAAIRCWDEALKIQPDLHRAWNNRASALEKLNRHAEAVVSYERAITANPRFLRAWDNLVWLKATSRDPNVRDPQRAIQIAAAACELTQHKNWKMLRTLAMCHAQLQQHDQAETVARQALGQAPEAERAELERLTNHYESQKMRHAARKQSQF